MASGEETIEWIKLEIQENLLNAKKKRDPGGGLLADLQKLSDDKCCDSQYCSPKPLAYLKSKVVYFGYKNKEVIKSIPGVSFFSKKIYHSLTTMYPSRNKGVIPFFKRLIFLFRKIREKLKFP